MPRPDDFNSNANKIPIHRQLLDQAGLQARHRMEDRNTAYRSSHTLGPYDESMMKDHELAERYDKLHNYRGQSTRPKSCDEVI